MVVNHTSSKIDVLAKPKSFTAGFMDDKRSIYWDNKCSKDWTKSDLSTKFALSERQSQLTLPKLTHKEWEGDRPSPIWQVSKTALKFEPSERLKSLAEAKKHHPNFQTPKSAYTVIGSAAKKANTSERVEMLAKPKPCIELAIKPDSCWDYSEWQSDVSKAALKCEPSGRVIQLAEPKSLNSAYKGCRPVKWPVSPGAKKAEPSMRVQQLAQPKSRSQYKEDYDSQWYQVNRAAMLAEPSPRVEELAQPIPRKVRQKKPSLVSS